MKKNIKPKPALQNLRKVSLKVKLLGLYFFSLTLLGFIGYGFFIYLEVENYAQDRQVLRTQSQFFEKTAFNHLKYTVNLHNHLIKVYNKAGSKGERSDKAAIINNFLNSVVVLSDENFNFAIFDYIGTMVTTNNNSLKRFMADDTIDHSAIYRVISEAAKSGIYSDYIEAQDDKRLAAWFLC